MVGSTSDIRRSIDPAIREDRRLIELLLKRDEYATIAAMTSSWLEESIAKKSDPLGLLDLRAKLLGNALALQERRSELIRAITEGDLGQRDPLALVTKPLFTIRGIADGIAWRAFDYDRLVIRQLSQHSPTGYLEADARGHSPN
jgi:hypothetical protein